MKVYSPTVGPIVGYTSHQHVRLWARGKPYNDGAGFRRLFGVAQVKKTGGQIETQFFKMRPKFDFTGIVDFLDLEKGKSYRYRVGYVMAEMEEEELASLSETLDWVDDNWHSFTTYADDKADISFAFGTCRYLSRFGIFDDRGDKTFKSLYRLHEEEPLDAFLMLGDQIYADDLWKINPDDKEKEFFKKYRVAYTQKYIRKVMSAVPTYMILDDHEIRNNWHRDMEDECQENRELFETAMTAYRPYQYVHGPGFKPPIGRDTNGKVLWYNFDCGAASFFALDTRTERRPSCDEMISENQMEAFLSWLELNKDRVKFVMSAVPFFPDRSDKNDSDKWARFSEQREQILGFIADKGIEKVVFLSGDIHSSGWATVTSPQNENIKIHQIISSPFYWPTSPGTNKRFKNYSTIADHNGTQFVVSDADFFTDDDNYTQVKLEGDKLKVVCYGRKGKRLGRETLSF